MAVSSCRRASSSLKPQRSRSRKNRSGRVPSLVVARDWQIARTSGARWRAWRANSCLLARMSAATNSRPVSVSSRSAWSTVARAEQDDAVDQGEQVIDLEVQLVGEVWEVFAATEGGEDLQQSGHPADGGRWQRLLGRGGRGGRGDGLLVAAGHHGVDLVDQGLEARGPGVAGAWQWYGVLGADAAGVGGQDQDAVGEQDGLVDVVGD